ncbi:hypothetical protein HUN41_00218 [Streptomyces phage Coruscant]|uniref:Uncharacterized protein n=1 Tax=Streptomyces phage Coruscant TaxID=2739834 RepID=A0A7G4AWC1_9CAUD|nr:hypothetical protein PP454_gp106 [Streptomyces phage Coruscant]QMP84311.1 hypothetical protein HUN41_00218 [Streptomyces phage Coruscant]
MIEGLEEGMRLIHHEILKLRMIMIGEEWDDNSTGYSDGLDRAFELLENMAKNLRNDAASQS